MDNWSVLLLSKALEGINDTLSVQRREKGSKTKYSVPCAKVVKLYNSDMGGAMDHLMDQSTAAYHLDRKSSISFYLHNFFDLMDIACVNSYLSYNVKNPTKLLLLDLKIVVAKKPDLIPSRPEKGSTNVETI